MKHINTWKPDTCGCEIHYEWDDAAPGVVTPVGDFTGSDGVTRQTKKCAAHAGIETHGELHEHIGKENRSKNMMLKHLVEDHAKFSEEEVDQEGRVSKKLKRGVAYEYSFTGKDKDRRLVVSLRGASVTANDKQVMRNYAAGLEKGVDVQ